MNITDEFKEEFTQMFDVVLLINNIETKLATFQALIDEVEYFSNRLDEEELNPEEEAIRKEELNYSFDQYTEYKQYLIEVLEDYMVKIEQMGKPIDIKYYKILKQLRSSNEN